MQDLKGQFIQKNEILLPHVFWKLYDFLSSGEQFGVTQNYYFYAAF